MKLIKVFILLTMLASFTYADSFYDLKLNNINGDKIELTQYKGKKVLALILPSKDKISQTVIGEIRSLLTTHDNLVIIGVPSFEDGFRSADKTSLVKDFKDLSSRFIITEAMNTRKNSGSSQSELFNWLTHVERNGYFNNDAIGEGHKFFINADGRLYAVISGNTGLSSQVTEKILAR